MSADQPQRPVPVGRGQQGDRLCEDGPERGDASGNRLGDGSRCVSLLMLVGRGLCCSVLWTSCLTRVSGLAVSQLVISSRTVWVRCVNGDLARRYGLTDRNPAGDYWKKIPGHANCLTGERGTAGEQVLKWRVLTAASPCLRSDSRG